MGSGVELIEDPEEVAFLKRRAKGIHVKSFVVAAVLTGIGILVGEILRSR